MAEVGAGVVPLIAPAALQHVDVLSAMECSIAAKEGTTLLQRFFIYHNHTELTIRRLLVHTPHPGPSAELPRKRKATGLSDLAAAASETVLCSGSVFGCSLGNICGYLSGRGIPRERASILRGVRAALLPAAHALRTMHGADAAHLARGMAACRVVGAQRAALPELSADLAPKLDSKYGNVATALGATASILAVFSVMAEVDMHAMHFRMDNSVAKTLRCADQALSSWPSATPRVPSSHWEALAAERRALQRAAIAAERAAAFTRDRTARQSVDAQLQAATRAAYPAHKTVNEATQSALRQESLEDWIMVVAPSSAAAAPELRRENGVVPLSEIREEQLCSREARDMSLSDASSHTGSCASVTSSKFSHVSGGSLGGVAEEFGALM